MTAAPPIRSLVWSLLGAVVALWLAYAIVAGTKQSAAQPPVSHAPAAPATAPVGLSLTPAPALRVRSSLFGPGRVVPVVRHAPRHRARTKTAVAAPAPAPQTTMTSDPAPVTTPAPVTPVQATPAPTPTPTPTPAPRPAARPKPQTTLTAQPKRSSGGGFDQSSASGFDQSG
jgi:hypothetical protein